MRLALLVAALAAGAALVFLLLPGSDEPPPPRSRPEPPRPTAPTPRAPSPATPPLATVPFSEKQDAVVQRVVGRIVDDAGDPVAHVTFVSLRAARRDHETDENGRFECALAAQDRDPWFDVLTRGRLRAQGTRSVAYIRRVRLPKRAAASTFDVGDIILDDGDLAVAGTVLGADGAVARDLPIGVNPDGTTDGTPHAQPVLRTDNHGRFKLVGGHFGARRLRIFARTKDTALAPWFTCARGTPDLRVRLTELGELRVELRMPFPMRHHALVGRLRMGSHTVIQRARTTSGRDRYEIKFAELVPGTYDFAFVVDGHPITSVPGVVVAPGPPAPLSLDLRDRLGSARLSARGAEKLRVWYRSTDGYRQIRPRLGRKLRALVLDGRPAHLLVTARGRGSRELEVATDTDISLPPAIPVQLRVDGLSAASHVEVSLRVAKKNPYPLVETSSVPVKNGWARLDASFPGPHEVSLFVDGAFRRVDPEVIDVAPAGAQTLRCRVRKPE